MNRSFAALLLVALGTALGVTLALNAPAPRDGQALEWLATPRVVAPFQLASQAGSFDEASLKGRWSIVVFGFVSCPDVCPTSLSRLAVVAQALADAALDSPVDFIFVSVDPGRDSVVDVGRYAQHFNPLFHGVTGTHTELQRFADNLGVQFKVTIDADSYRVAHSVTCSVIDPEGLLRGRFRLDFSQQELLRALIARMR